MDECSELNGGCEYYCSNTNGSFSCGCPQGLTLAANKVNCLGESAVSFTKALLFNATSDMILIVHIFMLQAVIVLMPNQEMTLSRSNLCLTKK